MKMVLNSNITSRLMYWVTVQPNDSLQAASKGYTFASNYQLKVKNAVHLAFSLVLKAMYISSLSNKETPVG